MPRLWLNILGGVLLVAVAVTYWWVYGSWERGHRSIAVLEQEALTGKTPADQERAAVDLADWAGDERQKEQARAALRRVLAAAKLANVRAAAIDGLARCRDWESVPAFITALADESETVRYRAGAACHKLLGVDTPFRPAAEPAVREAEIAAIQKLYEHLNEHRAKWDPKFKP